MQSDGESAAKKFALPGSKPHYPPSLSFTITHMQLAVEPNLQDRSISCEQHLEITALHDIDAIELNAVELHIKTVVDEKTSSKLDYRTLDDKLIIKLGVMLKEQERRSISISYAAKPRKGFYFIAPDRYYPKKRFEAWTQGQTIESRHWYPCIDHPQLRFTTDISVSVPAGFIAISNGNLKNIEQHHDNKKTYHWSESHPHPAYLTSIVIGEYANINKEGDFYLYYVPEDRKDDVKRSFENTANMRKFLENYLLDYQYPYDKYSQVTVQDFPYGGMENQSCSTLTLDTLHDVKAHIDFTSDSLVVHELAHQWFGDLVTCRDWQHLWLNEGFATYFESLYKETKNIDEFHYDVMQAADIYLDEAASRYARPIVTNVYKHPDELFDTHSYQKGSCVLHMLRHHLGDRYFRRSIKTYLKRFANSSVETDDLRKVFELETGKSLQQFFDQWVYREGHPELKVEFSMGKDMVKVKIEQAQAFGLFDFSIELKLVFVNGDCNTYSFDVSDKESVFQIPVTGKEIVDWFSIDPEFKILKNISIKASKEMLIKQLQNGATVVERIEAARALKEHASDDVVDALKTVILNDKFWGVGIEAAKSLSSNKSDYAYEALKKCLSIKDAKKKRAVINALGEFKKEELVHLLTNVLKNDESYFVQASAATSIGKTKSKQAVTILKEATEIRTFQDIVAQGAIAGLKEFAGDKEIAEFLIEKSRLGSENKIREAATLALGRFVDGNQAVFDHLRNLLLTDKWVKVRSNACKAFADAEAFKAIPDLTWVAEHDPDSGVRRTAEECIIIIKETMKKLKEVIEAKEEPRISRHLEFLHKMDNLERQLR
jgi:aminopeptidase N